MNRRLNMKMIAVALSLLMGVSVLALSNWGVRAGKGNRSLAERINRLIGGKAIGSDVVPAAVNSPLAPTITATKTDNLSTSVNPGDTITYTVAVGASGMDATGVMFNDTIDPNTTLVPGSVMTTPLALPDSYSATGNVRITVAAPGVLTNDVDPDGVGPALAVTAGTFTSTQGGNVVLNSNGGFTYNPPPGYEGTDTFTYTLNDGEGPSDTGTVTITISGMIWFIDNNAGSAGDGRLTNPFNTLAAFEAVNGNGGNNPAANDNIFIYESATAYTGPVTLENNQKLIGQDATGASLAAVAGITLAPNSDALPSLSPGAPLVTITSGGNAINVASGNTLRGFTVGNSTTDINGSGFGTLTISDVTLNGTGQALNLTTGTLVATINGITSTSGATGITLSGVAGSLSTSSTSISNSTGAGISVSSSSATIGFGSTTSSSSGGTGVFLDNNTGTITFGTLNISPDASQRGLHATNNSNTITASGGVVTTSGAVAVEITRSSGTTPLAISLTSVSANGGTNGIVLTNTNGSFTIVGDGTNTNNSSGGVIQNTTLAGISLTTVQNISLTAMNIHDIGRSGIDGQGVVNFTLDRSTINNVGTAAAGQYEESNIAFNDGGVFTNSSVSGTVTITNNTLTNARRHGIQIENGTGTISNLTISNNTLTSSTNAAVSLGSGILALIQGTAATTAHLTTGTISGNTITNFPSAEGIAILGGSGSSSNNTSATLGANGTPINITNNTISGQAAAASHLGSNAIRASMNSQVGVMNFNISCNGSTTAGCTATGPITNIQGQGISVFVGGSITGSTTIDKNVIVANQTLGAGTQGLAVQVDDGPAGLGTSAADYNVIITNNNVSNYEGNGIRAIARASLGKMDVTIQNNTVGTPILANRNGIRVDSGSAAGDVTLCMLMTGNTSDGSGVNAGIGIRKQGTVATVNDFGIVGLSPSPTTAANAAAKVATDNPTGGGVDVLSGDNFVSCGVTALSANSLQSSKATLDTTDESVDSVDSGGTLKAHHGEAPGRDDLQKISQQELTWMAQAAMQRWRVANISAEDLARLEAVMFELADLPAGQLASIRGTTVKIDESAAGYGWYVDQEPTDDFEFDVPVLDRERQTTEFSPAFNRIDLLTVVMRELGAVYLQGKDRVSKKLQSLMNPLLLPGVRRMPAGNLIGMRIQSQPGKNAAERVSTKLGSTSGGKGAMPGALKRQVPSAFTTPITYARPDLLLKDATAVSTSAGINPGGPRLADTAPAVATKAVSTLADVMVNVGTLPAGKSITITFQVTVNNPFPTNVCSVSNQGTVSGTNFTSVVTNDPDTVAVNDATVTTIEKQQTITAAAPISRQQGTAASTSQIATVNDCNQSAGSLTVTVDGGASATVNGVTVSGISVDSSGNVSASLVAGCSASNASFTLTVTDNTSKTATATLMVNVTPNTPPTLGTYPNSGPISVGAGTTVTPNAAPTDNGSVATLTASAPGFTGTFSGNPTTGVITVTNAMPAGVYTVTVTATDNCGATTNATFQLTVDTTPTITGATISRQQGTAASSSQIATVSDADQAANTLTVTVNGGATATVNGVTVSGISIDGSGNVTASVAAGCSATNASFTLTVTDNQMVTATATLTVNMTANTPPTLGNYPTTSVLTGGSTTVTPDAAPTDNGSVTTLTASAPGFAGTFTGNTATGVISITNASPGGVYTVTVTATDNCTVTSMKTFQLTVNAAPTISGATISRQQGSTASSSQIATVNDADQLLNTLSVTVNGGASATVNGVTVSGISVDASGNVTASVVANCTATNASFTLTVTDNQMATATATLTVNVSANTPPTLGNYPNAGVLAVGAGTTVTPDAAPTDNGTVSTLTASAPGFGGTLTGNTATGVITVTNATPSGTYTVTVTATDNCGATSTKTFTLTVNTPPSITGATISRQQGTAASSSQIATVSDVNQAANTLTVTVNGGASATVNGVTVSGISIDGSGNVTASAVASCTATNATFTLTVSDSNSGTNTATLTVNVSANTPPVLGNYPNTGTSPGGSTTVTPSAPPSDNGTVVSLTASAPGFTGTLTGNPATGVITVTNANPPGSFTVTVTATDNCGATAMKTFTLTTNTPPSITGATISRQQGAPASTSQIATVSDPDQAANTLVVTVNGGASATVNGVTVSGISVNASGQVSASVVASCTATNASFTLTVTDSSSATGTATLTVNVTASTPAVITLKPSIAFWPPDHNYHTVTIADMVASATDGCDGNVLSNVVIEKVTSDEPDNAPGNNDGNTTNDIVIAADCKSVQLRSERDDTKNGRVYNVTLKVGDASGNVTRTIFKVTVPINQSGSPAMDSGVALTVNGSCP